MQTAKVRTSAEQWFNITKTHNSTKAYGLSGRTKI